MARTPIPMKSSRDRFIIVVRDQRDKEEPWTVIFIPSSVSDTGFWVGMFLSDKEVEHWDALGYAQH